MTKPRIGQALDMMSREEFRLRLRHNYFGPSYDGLSDAIAQIEEVAWDNYINEKLLLFFVFVGVVFVFLLFELSVEWLEMRKRLLAAEARQKEASTRSRILLIFVSDRIDGSCP